MANILLIEPGYKNKYPPLGLMKIAQYHQGKGDNIKFIKGEDFSIQFTKWDRVYVTTLFSFEWERTARSIDFALSASGSDPKKLFVGGIAASLMQEDFQVEERWRGVRFIKGLLSESPAKSLLLSPDELYGNDLDGKPIEDMVPDYSILDDIDYKYPVRDAYFSYTSRGCVRKCKFCGVPKLEGAQRDTESLTRTVKEVANCYGEKRDLILMDNNITASFNFKNIISEIADIGFHKGAKINRGKSSSKRRVDFNQGVDARILCKGPVYMKHFAKICIKPLRIAFDHTGLTKPYIQSVIYAAEHGITELSNYMLYNFYDDPEDLYQRMRINIDMNEDLGVRIFSFPMRYQPLTRKDRGHIGKNWNSYYLRSMQVILQATHGVVSGSPDYFKFAFGYSHEEFERILLRPHHFIRNRHWYEKEGGRNEFDEFLSCMKKLTENGKKDLLNFLCSNKSVDYCNKISGIKNQQVREVANFFVPITRAKELEIWSRTKKEKHQNIVTVPDEERVEDACLTDQDV